MRRISHAIAGVGLALAAVSMTGPVAQAHDYFRDSTAPRVVFEDRFDRAELGGEWSVLNPDAERYVLENKELLVAGDTKDAFSYPKAKNVFVSNKAFVGGDVDLSATFRSEFPTIATAVQVGLYRDAKNFMAATLHRGGTSNDEFRVTIFKYENGTGRKQFVRLRFGFAKDKGLIQALNEKGARLILRKRGHLYWAVVELQGFSVKAPYVYPKQPRQVFATRPLFWKAPQGKPAFHVGTRKGAAGDAIAYFRRFAQTAYGE